MNEWIKKLNICIPVWSDILLFDEKAKLMEKGIIEYVSWKNPRNAKDSKECVEKENHKYTKKNLKNQLILRAKELAQKK